MTPPAFRRIRVALSLSQVALAAKINLSPASVYRKERGVQPITKRDAIAIRALKDGR